MKTVNILIVEDEPINLDLAHKFVKAILGLLDLEPNIALAKDHTQGFELIRSIADGGLDLVLSDLNCNPKDGNDKAGFKVLAYAKKMSPRVVSVLMTGNLVDDTLVFEGKGFKIDYFLQKPFKMDLLKGIFERHFKE